MIRKIVTITGIPMDQNNIIFKPLDIISTLFNIGYSIDRPFVKHLHYTDILTKLGLY